MKRSHKPTFIQCLAFACAITALMIGGILFIASIPVVEVSAVSGRCIQVLHPAPGENCNNLPARYRTMKIR